MKRKKTWKRKSRPRRMTILDVAAALDISPTAVSRGLRNLHGVSDELRKQIKQKASKLGYFPNLAGAALSTGKTRSIIYLMPLSDFPHLLQMEVLEGLTNELSNHGFNITIVSEQYLRGLKIPIAESLKGMSADGCVSLFLRTEDPELGIDDLHFPVVIVNKVVRATNADFVITDDDRGAYAVTEHLIRNGHKKIVYLGGPSDNFNTRRRLKGYRQALLDHGLSVDNNLIQVTDLTRSSGSAAMFRLLNDKRLDFTAVFGCNDTVALGALEALKVFGVRVPQDISVAGFDNESLSSVVEPAFTTVSKPRYEMGVAAGRLLLDRINGVYSGSPRTVTLLTALIARASTARAEPGTPVLVRKA
jgi:DNA-binding LacI/PurR family transcriptional regulator